MVGEACAHVQGESLKVQATFLSEVYQLPGHQDGEVMRIIKVMLMAIGGLAVAVTALWLFAGDAPDTEKADQQAKTVANATAAPETQRRYCEPEQTFHLEKLQANKSLKVVSLGEKGIGNIQRFLSLTMQNPIAISRVPRVRVWIAWQYQVQSLGGSAPAQGVIDVVQDDCVLYRRSGTAAEIVAIANGEWSQ